MVKEQLRNNKDSNLLGRKCQSCVVETNILMVQREKHGSKTQKNNNVTVNFNASYRTDIQADVQHISFTHIFFYITYVTFLRWSTEEIVPAAILLQLGAPHPQSFAF